MTINSKSSINEEHQWRDIETINDQLMGFYFYWVNPVQEMYGSPGWSIRKGFFYGMKDGVAQFDKMSKEFLLRITHWMPLPNPPTKRAEHD